MSRRAATAAAVAAAALAVAALAAWWWLPKRGGGPARPEAEIPAGPQARTPVRLYFPGEDGRLYPERREIAAGGDADAALAALVRELLQGPRSEGLQPPLPPGIELGAAHVSETGIAYLDLRSPDGSPPPPSGSLRELLTIYSLVDTVALNLPEVRAVALLWNGRQPESFAGHVDTTRPLAPDLGLLAAGAEREGGEEAR